MPGLLTALGIAATLALAPVGASAAPAQNDAPRRGEALAQKDVLRERAGPPAQADETRPQQVGKPGSAPVQLERGELQPDLDAVAAPLLRMHSLRGRADDALIPSRQMLETVRVPAALETLVAQLDDPSYEKREHATDAILGSSFDLLELYAVLARGAISAEQRHRLISVVRRMLVDRPRGALGVRMQFEQQAADQPGEVVIRELIPGLPAIDSLRPGDRVRLIDGSPLLAQTDLIRIVQSKRPGDAVRLEVRRQRTGEDGNAILDEAGQVLYEELSFELVLGSTERLDQFDPMQRLRKTPAQLEDEQRADLIAALFGPQPRLIEIRN
jgi:hypothetical protein